MESIQAAFFRQFEKGAKENEAKKSTLLVGSFPRVRRDSDHLIRAGLD
jgi:hypothetical protein